jgi:hypothetical protein
MVLYIFITSLIFLDQFRPTLKHTQPQKVTFVFQNFIFFLRYFTSVYVKTSSRFQSFAAVWMGWCLHSSGMLHAVWVGSWLATFRDSLSIPSKWSSSPRRADYPIYWPIDT